MSKENKVRQEEAEEIADAKTGAVATVGTGAVSTQVSVRGASIRFATMSPFYSVSSVPQECAQECREGDLYVKTGKTSAWRIAGSGKANALKAFVIDAKEGILEGSKGANESVPRSWAVGRPWQGKDGKVIQLSNLQECAAAAKEETGGTVPFYRFEDFSKVTNPIPEHYLARCVYLEMLVRVPDTFGGDVPLVKVGGGVYSPVRVLLKKFDPIKVEQFFRNIKVKEDVRHRGETVKVTLPDGTVKEEPWKWTPYGQCVSVFTTGIPIKRPNGSAGYLWAPSVEAFHDDKGLLYVPDAEEKGDLALFQASLADSVVDVGDVQDGEF